MKIAFSSTEIPDKPVEEVIEWAQKYEINYLELWLNFNFLKEETKKVVKLLSQKKTKLACLSTWTPLNESIEKEELENRKKIISESIEVAYDLGAKYVNTYFGAHPQRTTDHAIKFYRENILPCVELAEKKGVTILLENEFHPDGNEPTRKANNVLKIIEAVNSSYFRVNFDPCNFYIAGEEPYPYAYEVLKKYIEYIHLKDAVKYDKNLHREYPEKKIWRDKEGGIFVCVPLGEGEIKYQDFLSQLQKDGYSGFLTLEPHLPVQMLNEGYKKAMDYLRKKIRRCK